MLLFSRVPPKHLGWDRANNDFFPGFLNPMLSVICDTVQVSWLVKSEADDFPKTERATLDSKEGLLIQEIKQEDGGDANSLGKG